MQEGWPSQQPTLGACHLGCVNHYNLEPRPPRICCWVSDDAKVATCTCCPQSRCLHCSEPSPSNVTLTALQMGQSFSIQLTVKLLGTLKGGPENIRQSRAKKEPLTNFSTHRIWKWKCAVCTITSKDRSRRSQPCTTCTEELQPLPL
jgi:hypothetical protein